MSQVENHLKNASRIRGSFSVPIEEESLATKAFPIPGTSQYVTANVAMTDELGAGEKLLLAMGVSGAPAANAGQLNDSATSDLNFTVFTFAAVS